jgi:hypothetical protein
MGAARRATTGVDAMRRAVGLFLVVGFGYTLLQGIVLLAWMRYMWRLPRPATRVQLWLGLQYALRLQLLGLIVADRHWRTNRGLAWGLLCGVMVILLLYASAWLGFVLLAQIPPLRVGLARQPVLMRKEEHG